MNTRQHHRWARYMAVEATRNIQRLTVSINQPGTTYKPALSLVPRSCPTCHKIAMYRFTQINLPDVTFVYYLWQCAECFQMGILATELDGKELPMKLFDLEGNWL